MLTRFFPDLYIAKRGGFLIREHQGGGPDRECRAAVTFKSGLPGGESRPQVTCQWPGLPWGLPSWAGCQGGLFLR